MKGVTTPLDIANQISKGLAKKTVVAKVGSDVAATAAGGDGGGVQQLRHADRAELAPRRLPRLPPLAVVASCARWRAAGNQVAAVNALQVDGSTWDLTRPLEGDCALQLLSFDDPEGKEVRWAA